TIQVLIQDRQQQIEDLKNRRKLKSATLQQRLFAQYQFLNARGEKKNVLAIFTENNKPTPPAGAGECAAPKLLNYAYQHQLKPICMADFWWGVSPSSEVRKHNNYIIACKRKCVPILTHYLKGYVVCSTHLRFI